MPQLQIKDKNKMQHSNDKVSSMKHPKQLTRPKIKWKKWKQLSGKQLRYIEIARELVLESQAELQCDD